MKIVQVVPKANAKYNLKALLKAKERELRGGPTAFKRRNEGHWAHVKHPGWITWDETVGGILVAEIHTRGDNPDWQLLQSFVGYLDRHLGDHIETISITYR